MFIITLKLIPFDFTESKLIYNFLSKLNIFLIAFCFIASYEWSNINRNLKILCIIIIILCYYIALISLSKTNILLLILANIFGAYFYKVNLKTFFSLTIIAFIFLLLNPKLVEFRFLLTNFSYTESLKIMTNPSFMQDGFFNKTKKTNHKYLNNFPMLSNQPISTSSCRDAHEKIIILKRKNTDPLLLSSSTKIFFSKCLWYYEYDALIKSLNRSNIILHFLKRFELAAHQGFLINQFDDGQKGKTLSEFWHVFIPRILWKEKPIITRHGQELSKTLYTFTNGSFAPSISVEAYWNYGYFGLVLIAILFSLLLSFFNFLYLKFRSNMRFYFPYFVILTSVNYLVWSQESWFVATVLGQSVIYVLLFLLINIFTILYKKINS